MAPFVADMMADLDGGDYRLYLNEINQTLEFEDQDSGDVLFSKLLEETSEIQVIGSSWEDHLTVDLSVPMSLGISFDGGAGNASAYFTYRKNDPLGPRFDSFETFYAQRDRETPFCFWYGSISQNQNVDRCGNQCRGGARKL